MPLLLLPHLDQISLVLSKKWTMVQFLITHPCLHLPFLLWNQIWIPLQLTTSLSKTLTLPDPTKGLLKTFLPVGATLTFVLALITHIHRLLLPQFTCGTLELGPYLALLEQTGSRIIFLARTAPLPSCLVLLLLPY